jgi:hypothetical protein
MSSGLFILDLRILPVRIVDIIRTDMTGGDILVRRMQVAPDKSTKQLFSILEESVGAVSTPMSQAFSVPKSSGCPDRQVFSIHDWAPDFPPEI